MAVKARLQRKGTKKRPFYHIVIADSRSPRDGKFIEKIGTYNPLTVPATIILDTDKAYEWITKGAQPTDTVHAIFKYRGVFFKKHLQRGVTKGALTQEKADELFAAWIQKKDAQIESNVAATVAQHEERRRKIFGEPTPKKAKATEENTENTEA